MARVLMVGVDPDEVDFSDPDLPPGLDADKIRAGIEVALAGLRAAGHDAAQAYIPTDPAKLGDLARRLADDPVDVVTIGGGVTRPVRNAELFEAVLNVIGKVSPTPRVALVIGPQHAPAAVARVLAP